MEKKLPKDFFWGGSVSSFQTEGAWDEGGKGLSIYDVRPTPEGHADWKVAIDEYHRYKEDIQLMKEMGFNFYRFSICWSRIIPNGDDEVNEEGVQFYNNLIDELIANGITPMIATVYKGNIIKNLIMDCQSYTKYRPNETTGGIFVSWRRKEELPTGA